MHHDLKNEPVVPSQRRASWGVKPFKPALLVSVSISAMLGALSISTTSGQAQSTCTTFMPASGQTLTCTFDVDAFGDPIPIAKPINAPRSTNVTVSIQDISRPGSEVGASLGSSAPAINLGGGASITISNADVTNLADDVDLDDAFATIFSQSGITSIQDLAGFLNDQGIPATVEFDTDGDEFIDIADEDIPSATTALVGLLDPATGSVVELGAGADNTINLGTTGPGLFAGEVFGVGAGGVRTADGSSTTINLGDGGISGLGADGFAIQIGASSALALNGAGGDVTSAGDNAPAIRAEGGTNAIDLILAETSITTSGANSPGISLSGDNSVLNLQFDQPGAVIFDPDNTGFLSTLGSDSPFFELTGDSSTVTISLNGDPAAGVSTGETFGDNSPFLTSDLTTSSLAMTVDQGELTTTGNNSQIVDSIAKEGSDALFFFDNSTLSTSGDNSSIFRVGANGSSIGTIVVVDSLLSTTGDRSTAVDFQGATGTSSFTGFIGGATGTTITTSGDDALGVLFTDGAQTTSNSTVTLNNVDVNTTGERSFGVVSADGAAAGSALEVTIASSSITTQGSFADAVTAKALAENGSATSVTVGGPLAPDGNTISTSGTGSAGLHASFGAQTDSVGSLIISQNMISTTGDIADGVVLESAIGGTADATAVSSNLLTDNTIKTSGRLSNSLVIGKDVTVVPVGTPLSSGAANVQIDAFSFDNLSAKGIGGRAILNNGTIQAGATGLTFGMGVAANIADNGLISGTGATAATFNATDDIFEIQPGSTSSQIVDAAGGIDTFVLGGEGTATFDRNRIGTQFLDFERFVKEDLSIFTLSSPNDLAFTITGGELVIADDPLQTAETQFTVTTGITRTTNTMTGRDEIQDTSGTLTIADSVNVDTVADNTPAVSVVGAGIVNVLGTINTTGDGSAAIAAANAVPGGANAAFELSVRGVAGGVLISTKGDNAGGIDVTGPGAGSAATVTLDDLVVATGGDNSVAVNGGSVVNDASVFSFSAQNLGIITSGTNSGGLVVEGLVGNGPGDSIVLANTVNTDVMTTGNNSVALQLGDANVDAAGPANTTNSNRTFVTDNTNLDTSGDGSAGLLVFGNGDGNSLSDTHVLAETTTVITSGNDATGAAFDLFGDNLDVTNTTIVVDDLSVSTTGDRSNGLVFGDTQGSNQNITNSSVQVAFNDINIATEGDDAIGFILDPFGSDANGSVATVAGNNTTISTSGARAHGLVFGEGLGTNVAGMRAPILPTSGLANIINDSFDNLEAELGGGPFKVISQLAIDNFDISTSGVDANGVLIGANSTVPFWGTVSTTGDGGNGFVLAPTAALDLLGTTTTTGKLANGIWADGQATINLAGSINVSGANADGIENYLDNGTSTSITVEDGGNVSATGAGGSGIYLTSFPDRTGSATATINIDQGGTVSSTQNEAIREWGGAGTVINTALTVEGRVERSNPDDLAVDLAEGDDTLVIFPTAEIFGGIDLGPGFDIFATDGAAGTTGNLALLAGGVPFAVDVERIEKRGEGTWIFEGIDIPAGAQLAPAFILDGTAVISLNARGLDLTNEVSGRVEGTGSVENFINNGTFAPGDANTAGGFGVANNLTFNSVGTLEVDIFANGSSDLITVGGDTLLDGTLAVNAFDFPSGFPTSQDYVIISGIETNDTITGAFANVTDNLPDLNVSAMVNPAIVGEVDPDTGASIPDAPASVVVSYDQGGAPSDKSIHPNSVQAGAAAGREFTDILQNRARLGSAGGKNVAAPGRFTFAQLSSQSAAGVNDLGAAQAFPLTDSPEGQYAWFTGFGSFIDVDGSAATTGYESRSGGFAIGMDHVFFQDDALISVGLAGGYSAANIDSGQSSADIDTWQIGIYGNVERDALRVSGAATYGIQDYELDRVIPVGQSFVTANGDADGSVFSVSVAASYDVAPMLGWDTQNNTHFAPLIRFDHVHAERDGFVESGAGVLNLTVDSDSFTRNYLSLGFETSTELTTKGGALVRPSLEVRWEHGFGDDQVNSNSIIAGVEGTNFNSVGVFEDRDRVVVGAGLEVSLSENLSVIGRYDGSFASDFQGHGGSIGFRLEF